ncbi:MAG: type II toxin-antitoxin system prevent-host-death family antitoxin, partial [Actinomycetota bacterium]|nr:type II toxin-antitoxin system prevent-host-death family antitoxin [Actinomycetota bacterium]
MVEVGIRELRNALSRYLARVRRGETLLVTDRGRPVARILPARVPEDLAVLLGEGRARWSGARFEPPEQAVELRAGPTLSE